MPLRHRLVICATLVVMGSAFADALPAAVKKSMDDWQKLMTAADGAVEKKAHGDDLMNALEATETFHSGHAEQLKAHPDYEKALEHQLAIRLSLVKLYANVSFMYAKTAAEKRDAKLLTQRGGALERMEQAQKTLQAYVAIKGEADPGAQKMTTYVAELKKQVDGVAPQLEAAAAANPPPAAVDKGTENYFRQWVEKLADAEKATSPKDAGRALEAARHHQKGWDSWLQKHPDYAKTLARQDALGTRLTSGAVEPELEAALAQAQKGLDDKNPNFFGPNSGPHQKLKQARASLAALAQAKGEKDPEVVRLTNAANAAEQKIEAMGKQLSSDALAKREMPSDGYAGSDKAALKGQILAHWKKKYPNDKVLGVRFFQTEWTRETNWKSNATSIYKSDYSWLGVKVVVQKNDEVASLFPAFANKQHQNSDQVIVSDDRSGSSYVVGEMLMKNVRF